MSGSIHYLADEWVREQRSGSDSGHTHWFYANFHQHLTETYIPAWKVAQNDPDIRQVRTKANPESISKTTCILINFYSVYFAVPATLGSLVLGSLLVALLFAITLYSLLWSHRLPHALCVFATGYQEPFLGWRYRFLKKVLSFINFRALPMYIALCAPVAVWVGFDRYHANLTSEYGYSIGARTIFVLLVLLVFSFTSYFALTCIICVFVRVFRIYVPVSHKCADCCYPLTDLSRCPECGSVRKIRPLRLHTPTLSACVCIMLVAIATVTGTLYYYSSYLSSFIPNGLYARSPRALYLNGQTRSSVARTTFLYFYTPFFFFDSDDDHMVVRYYFYNRGLRLRSEKYSISVVFLLNEVSLSICNGCEDADVTNWSSVERRKDDVVYTYYSHAPDSYLEIVVETKNWHVATEVSSDNAISVLTIISDQIWTIPPAPP